MNNYLPITSNLLLLSGSVYELVHK